MSRRGAFWCERGNIAPLAVMATLVLFAVLAFSVDQGIACAAKVRQENALDAARAACMDSACALVAKNEDEPGLFLASQIAQQLRDEGFSGEVSVWFYEVPKAQLPLYRRVWGVAIQMQEHVPTVFAQGFGMDTLAVASKRVMVAEPYADTKTWRPERDMSGRFDLEKRADESALTFTPLFEAGEYPSELMNEVNVAVAGAKQ